MIGSPCLLPALFRLAVAAAVLLTPSLSAQPVDLPGMLEVPLGDEELMHPGVGFIMSLRGTVVRTGAEATGALERGSVIREFPFSFSTGGGSYLLMVLSNGLCLYAGENVSLTIEQFSQERFEPSLDNWQFEPSRSEIAIRQNAGRVAYLRIQGDPSSAMWVKTPLGTLSSLSDYFALEIHDNDDTDVWLFAESGTAIFNRGELEREFLQAGQHLRVTRSGENRTNAQYTPLEPAEQRYFESLQNRLRSARQRVFFFAEANGGNDWHLRPRVVIDINQLKRERKSDYFIHR